MKDKSPITSAELGLAIASLVVGAIISLCAIPAAYFNGFERSAAAFIVITFPFAIACGAAGYIGRKSALGVAGMSLSVISCCETVGVVLYGQYQEERHKSHEIVIEKIRLEVANANANVANAEITVRQLDKQIEEIKVASTSARADEYAAQRSNLAAQREVEQSRLAVEQARSDAKELEVAQAKLARAEETKRAEEQLVAKKISEQEAREKQLRDELAATEQKRQLEMDHKIAAEHAAELARAKTFFLKDGKQVKAVRATMAGDYWSVVDSSGKKQMIYKGDIETVLDPATESP